MKQPPDENIDECSKCGTYLSERKTITFENGISNKKITWYCYNCENAALWALGRSVGK